MEGLRDFLEGSTIHGLCYISTVKSLGMRLFWIAVVIGGFSTAGYLIHSSLSAWEETPIATTITTLPITEAPLPLVTVCPPENTVTSLNYDLGKAEHATLSENVRNNLAKLASDGVFEDVYNKQMSFLEKHRYENLYEGKTLLSLPFIYSLYYRYSYNFRTTATAGFVSSPYFGKKFSIERFQIGELVYDYEITLPTNITHMNEANLSFVVNIEMDLKETSN